MMRHSMCKAYRPVLGLLGRRHSSLRYHSSVAQIFASSIGKASERNHIDSVHHHLDSTGVVKIKLGFEDDESKYTEQLILSLHKHYGHGLPITHSASRGWFWDVRPLPGVQQSVAKPARSETAEEFPWHTDCSYEWTPPRYIALQVLQPDRQGGGTLSILNLQQLVGLLSPSTRKSLSKSEYRITVPPEFIKSDETHIIAPLLGESVDNGATEFRYRGEIISPLTESAQLAVQELSKVLLSPQAEEATVHLTPEMMPRGSIILLNNRRWLHARSEVNDPHRHLRRVRWDARPFTSRESLAA